MTGNLARNPSPRRSSRKLSPEQVQYFTGEYTTMDETTEVVHEHAQFVEAPARVRVFSASGGNADGSSISVSNLQASDIADAVTKFMQMFPGYMLSSISSGVIDSARLVDLGKSYTTGEEVW